ncbi:hypothetical protein FKW77_004182 [Venturia effusa]|uniref:Uncharacterized protein n=1 Tax=Venturia effusa TaxID=50376 RepID=A0A517LGZ5_9PEZI|nr:hypothetical protein FKW77_004182 [Venturia effusa]
MAETAAPPPRRRDTASSQASQASMSLRRRITKPSTSNKSSSSSAAPKTCQDSISSYNLSWEKLKPWLEQKYPELQFTEKTLVDDKYIFEVPVGKRLTEQDKREIAKLKDNATTESNAEPRRAITPELLMESDSDEE